MKRFVTHAALAAVLFCLTPPALAGAAASDAWITTKAKMTLLTTEDVSATAINVDTTDGRVTLHGKVSSTAEKEKAESAVKNIDGVKEVRNLLQVVPAKREPAAKKTDAAVKEAVEQALKRDKSLADSSISVQSVNDGVVLLAGKAETVTDHLRAIEDASRVQGVRRVASEIQSPDKLADDEIWRSERAKTEKDHGVTDSASDLRITATTKLRLIADSQAPALDINVDTRDGVVTLFGIVPTTASKKAAEADARKVSGVKRVVNELQIVPNAARERVDAKDDDVKRAVEQAIADRNDLKDVDVEVKNGVVRLTGSVPREEDRLRAAITARGTAGVRSVQDDLRIAAEKTAHAAH
jgi:osmotically-inducible protein OsmY